MSLGDIGIIGNLTLKNRIVMAPMISNLCNTDGSPSEAHISYLEERARGGVSLIITEYSTVDQLNSRGSRNQLSFANPALIPKLRRLTEAIHSHDCLVFAQLVHSGGKGISEINSLISEAPSATDYPGHTPLELNLDEIRRIEEAFGRAAAVAQHANFDGIELHGAHGY
ncbi:MAG: hypothetical protein QXP70_06375, partial [Methanomassiliicoccales archaeon]